MLSICGRLHVLVGLKIGYPQFQWITIHFPSSNALGVYSIQSHLYVMYLPSNFRVVFSLSSSSWFTIRETPFLFFFPGSRTWCPRKSTFLMEPQDIPRPSWVTFLKHQKHCKTSIEAPKIQRNSDKSNLWPGVHGHLGVLQCATVQKRSGAVGRTVGNDWFIGEILGNGNGIYHGIFLLGYNGFLCVHNVYQSILSYLILSYPTLSIYL